jgi:hypothetical protein
MFWRSVNGSSGEERNVLARPASRIARKSGKSLKAGRTILTAIYFLQARAAVPPIKGSRRAMALLPTGIDLDHVIHTSLPRCSLRGESGQMKTLMLMACMAVSSVAAAQDTVYDYQGAVMTGVGGPETITAQLDLIGPVSDLTFNVSVSIAGSSYSTQFPANGCSVVCSSAGSPMSFQFNEKNGKFVGADLTMANLPGPPYDNELLGVLSIGAKGDSLKFTDVYFGNSPISVSNSTPGIWKYMGAPELNAGGALSAIALLAVCLLLLTERRKSSTGLASAK